LTLIGLSPYRRFYHILKCKGEGPLKHEIRMDDEGNTKSEARTNAAFPSGLGHLAALALAVTAEAAVAPENCFDIRASSLSHSIT